MSLIEILFLAIALAMDCFTVSVTCGLIQKRLFWSTMLITAFMFGLFQGVMPVLGWLGISMFSEVIQRWDHWIAFSLLAFLGCKMIIEGLKTDTEEKHFNPASFKMTITLAIATSIDAFAVGLSFGCLGMNTLSSIILPIVIIGLISFIMSIIGYLAGIKLGHLFKFPVEAVGGAILVIIGLKILIEHLIR
jgi:manganese efflux pump family protein